MKDGKQAVSGWTGETWTGEKLKCEALGALAPPLMTDLRKSLDSAKQAAIRECCVDYRNPIRVREKVASLGL